jgi:hypothetical protein
MPGRGLSTFSYPQVIPPSYGDIHTNCVRCGDKLICYCQVVTMGEGCSSSGGGKFHLNEDAPNALLN